MLPNANCGACGNAGCYDFAVKVVDGEAKINGCPVGGQDVVDEIARILGMESSASVKLVARILCNGGNIEATRKATAEYNGPMSCSVQTIVAGGDKMLSLIHISSSPDNFYLSQNYPNPFNPSTKITYSVASLSNVILKVYDILGREVLTLVNEEKPAGRYEVSFNASSLASGVYFYQIKAGSFVQTKKLMLLK